MPLLRATPKLCITPPRPERVRAMWLGLVAGLLTRVFFRRKPRLSGGDLKRHDYRWSTQRMGVSFSERIRDTFRFRWIRKTS